MQLGAGSVIGGKFRLERPLSRGGMGSVWVARHVSLGSPVAVKFMDSGLATSPAFVARFEREARIAANLQSPHVVHVQDYGIDGGVPYLVMELLQGEDLGTRLGRVGRLTIQEAARLLGQIGKALRRAHEAGLVHRDLKPGNIFLARVDDDEIAKVLDFGIVKESGGQITGEVTRTGEVLGSPHYMSPEQVRGEKDVDHRSDLWSLGVILYRAITGQLPFPGDQLGSVIAKILVDPYPRATSLASDLPPTIDVFFARALSREKSSRFQSVGAMLEELNRIAGTPPLGASVSGGHPAVGWPTSPAAVAPVTNTAPGVSRTGKAPSRKPSLAPLVLAIGGAVLAIGGGAALFGWRSSGAASEAVTAPPEQTAAPAAEVAPAPAPTEAAAPAVSASAEEAAVPAAEPVETAAPAEDAAGKAPKAEVTAKKPTTTETPAQKPTTEAAGKATRPTGPSTSGAGSTSAPTPTKKDKDWF